MLELKLQVLDILVELIYYQSNGLINLKDFWDKWFRVFRVNN